MKFFFLLFHFLSSFEYENLEFQILHDTEVSLYHGCFEGQLHIPSQVEYQGVNYTVTQISANASYRCSNFTGSLVIPETVRTIGEYAFYSCSGFTGSLIIPDSLTIIERNAFSHCSGFNDGLIIGNSVTEIGRSAFYECSGLTGSLTIPDSVRTICFAAFYSCTGFTGFLKLGYSVNEIEDYAFYNCYGLNIIYYLGVEQPSIESNSFYNVNPTFVYVTEQYENITFNGWETQIFNTSTDDLEELECGIHSDYSLSINNEKHNIFKANYCGDIGLQIFNCNFFDCFCNSVVTSIGVSVQIVKNSFTNNKFQEPMITVLDSNSFIFNTNIISMTTSASNSLVFVFNTSNVQIINTQCFFKYSSPTIFMCQEIGESLIINNLEAHSVSTDYYSIYLDQIYTPVNLSEICFEDIEDTEGINGIIYCCCPGESIFQKIRIDNNKCEGNKSGNILFYINVTTEESIVFENMIFSNLKSAILFSIDQPTSHNRYYQQEICNVIFINNECKQEYGGGCSFYIKSSEEIIFNNCSWISNQAYKGIIDSLRNSHESGDGGGFQYGYRDDMISSKVILLSCSFINNRAERNGGALSLSLGNDVYIENCHFENNTAGYLQNNNEFYGGAIFIESSFSYIYNNINYPINVMNETNIINCTFVNNSAENGHGLFFKGSGTNTLFNILGSQTTFINNINHESFRTNDNYVILTDTNHLITSYVHYIYNNANYSNEFSRESNPIKFIDYLQVSYENIDISEWHFEEFSSELESVHIYNCSFRNPKTDNNGYLFFINTPIFEFMNCTIVYETNKERNGGLQINYTNQYTKIDRSIFSGCFREYGSCILYLGKGSDESEENRTLKISNSVFQNSQSQRFGSGIYLESNNATFTNCIFEGFEDANSIVECKVSQ